MGDRFRASVRDRDRFGHRHLESQHRTRRLADDLLRRAPHEQPAHARSAVGANNDQVGVDLAGDAQDLCGRITGLEAPFRADVVGGIDNWLSCSRIS
jgi:hypothetical protein